MTQPTYEELEERIALLESDLVIEINVRDYWKNRVDQLHTEMRQNPVSIKSLRHRLYWYQRRYAPLVRKMEEASRFQYTPLGEVAKIAVQRGKKINQLERKLGKRNRLSARQHRFIREKVDTRAAPVV